MDAFSRTTQTQIQNQVASHSKQKRKSNNHSSHTKHKEMIEYSSVHCNQSYIPNSKPQVSNKNTQKKKQSEFSIKTMNIAINPSLAIT